MFLIQALVSVKSIYHNIIRSNWVSDYTVIEISACRFSYGQMVGEKQDFTQNKQMYFNSNIYMYGTKNKI